MEFVLSLAYVTFVPMMVVLFFVGVIYMPLAAAFCWSIARSRNMSAWSLAVRGATYSAALLVPWLYLLRLEKGRTVRFATGMVVYILLYAGWFLPS